MEGFVFLVVVATSIWVFVDAKSIGVKKGQISGIADMGPWGWFWVCLLLWIIGFPFYLAKRSEYKAANAAPSMPPPVPPLAPQPVADPLTQLERFAQLRDKGILTEAEFQAKKAQLLG